MKILIMPDGTSAATMGTDTATVTDQRGNETKQGSETSPRGGQSVRRPEVSVAPLRREDPNKSGETTDLVDDDTRRKKIIDKARAAYMAAGTEGEDAAAREAAFDAQMAILENEDSTPEDLYDAFDALGGAMRYHELGVLLQGDTRRERISDIGVSKTLASLVQEGWLEELPSDERAELLRQYGEQLSILFSFDKTLDERAKAIIALGLPAERIPQIFSFWRDEKLITDVVALVKHKQELKRIDSSADGEMSQATTDVDADGKLDPVPLEQQLQEAIEAFERAEDSTAPADAKENERKRALELLKKILWDYPAKTHFRKVVKGVAIFPGVPIFIAALLLTAVVIMHAGGGKK